MQIKKDGKKITLIGKEDVVTNFVKASVLKESIIGKMEKGYGNVEYRLVDDSEESGYIEQNLVDFYDDKLFDLLVGYNTLFKNKVDFNAIEHSAIVIDSRDELLGILNNQ